MPATATQLRNLMKIAMAPKRIFINTGNVFRWNYCLQQSAPVCGLTDGGVTMLTSSQGCKLSNFALIL